MERVVEDRGSKTNKIGTNRMKKEENFPQQKKCDQFLRQCQLNCRRKRRKSKTGGGGGATEDLVSKTKKQNDYYEG